MRGTSARTFVHAPPRAPAWCAAGGGTRAPGRRTRARWRSPARQFSTTVRALSAASAPIELKSSWPAERRDRAGAGRVREHLALVDQRGRGVLGEHQPRRQPRARREEGRQPGVAGGEQRVGAPLAEARPARTARGRGGRAAATAAGRGSCRRPRRRRRRGRRAGCRSRRAARARARPRCSPARRRRRRAPAARSAACRGPARGRSRRGWRRPRCRRAARAGRAATRCAPGCGRTRVQALVERDGRALERLERQRRRRRRPRRAAAARRARASAAGRRHQVRAVDEREALLGLERDRREAGARRAPRRRAARSPSTSRLALADEHERDVRQRREVARRADRALGRHHGHDAALEHRQQQLDDLLAHARVPAPQRRGEQQRASRARPRPAAARPAPTACERTRLSCSSAASSAPMRTLGQVARCRW